MRKLKESPGSAVPAASLCRNQTFWLRRQLRTVSAAESRYDVTLHALLLSLQESRYFEAETRSDSSMTPHLQNRFVQSSWSTLAPQQHFNWVLAQNRCWRQKPSRDAFSTVWSNWKPSGTVTPYSPPEIPSHTLETWDKALLALVRELSRKNWSASTTSATRTKSPGSTNRTVLAPISLQAFERRAQAVEIPAFGFIWLMRTK